MVSMWRGGGVGRPPHAAESPVCQMSHTGCCLHRFLEGFVFTAPTPAPTAEHPLGGHKGWACGGRQHPHPPPWALSHLLGQSWFLAWLVGTGLEGRKPS